MVAPVRQVRRRNTIPDWHAGFLALLPRIQEYALFAFRGLDAESKQEALQCVVAGALAAYVRLVQLGKTDLAFATPLAMFGVRQYRDGRRFGSHLNVHDVSSEYARRVKSIRLERLDQYDPAEDKWKEVLIQDRHAGPFDIVRTKLDFAAWLRSLPAKRRKVAKALAADERTHDVARKFGLSDGRISQIRAELLASWRQFVGDEFDKAVS